VSDAAAMKLVLFDIDGTILWSDGAGRRAMTEALTSVFGSAGPTDYRYDGKTDPQIVRDLMRATGHDDATIDERIDPLMTRYLGGLERELAAGTHAHVFDGVRELLDALEARDDVLLGLLTGNVQPGAIAKLSAVGIEPERFRVGAFGSDHADRPELPAIARERAEALLGREIAGGDVVVIGDTPADMGCGRAIGARAIGVATGRYSADELRACGAVAAFEDLSDTDAVVHAIMGA
jgi:phosphoglycolate phosphatase